jgi:cytosine/adenosine deaminase-related metal-dependent hydrolase
METVHDTDAVFEALVPTGLRAVVGKCLMDERGEAPARLHQPARDALDESLALHRRWHGAGDGRLHAALAPRFALSCTRELLEATAAASASHGLLVHTHASEQRDEVNEVRARTGLANIHYFETVGLATPNLRAAHCVWLTESEQRVLAERSVGVLHCPGSNLKLGSGIAPISELRSRGVRVSLGADGAACNNTLDIFQEMRLAATLQAVKYGPGALAADEVVYMATREGARALGLDATIGSIEIGKAADLCVIDTRGLHQRPASDPYSILVFSSDRSDVRATIVDGHIRYQNGRLSWGEAAEIGEAATAARVSLARRAGLA